MDKERRFGRDIEYGSDYWDKLGWKQGTDKGIPRETPAIPGEEIIITPPDDTNPIFDSGVKDTGTVDGPLPESDADYSISNRVDDYIDSLGLTGKDAEETRANTLAVTDPTTAAAIARQQERTITERTDDWLQKQYTAAGLGQVDEEGGQHWKKDLASGQTRTQVKANIMRHSKPAPSPSPSPSPTVTITPSRSNPSPSPSPSPIITTTPSVSQKADDWLQKAYTSAGLGTVDAGGRAYWQKDRSGGQTQAQIVANIMRHKK